ncbi:MAG: hypothetical protein H0T76_26165 [Nannocystis sp.]|nr:hypothetical protein [Nannocystis sp.]MBA3549979.1 hypothetical protein [Nannocystis sp.]
MHRFHSPAARRGIGVHIARIAVFSAAVMAITGVVVADVIAAEDEEPAAMVLGDDDSLAVDMIADERGPLQLAVVVPIGALPVAGILPQFISEPDFGSGPPKLKKKRRSGKLKFGRFEGY